jgi:hypothetical protein
MASGFVAALPESVVASLGSGIRANAQLLDGQPLPAWLHFDAEKMLFSSASVPPVDLPMLVVVRSSNTSFVVRMNQKSM